MHETPQELQKLHEVLKASKAAKYFIKIHWPEYSERLILESPSATESNQLLIHITVDKDHTGRFAYDALTNRAFNDREAYKRLEQKDNATTEEIIEVVYRLLEPELRQSH